VTVRRMNEQDTKAPEPMNPDKAITTFVTGMITVAALTPIFGRGTAPKVLDSIGTSGSNLISAAVGKQWCPEGYAATATVGISNTADAIQTGHTDARIPG
jgi:hypothetical protein